jgi:hypothetical protein
MKMESNAERFNWLFEHKNMKAKIKIESDRIMDPRLEEPRSPQRSRLRFPFPALIFNFHFMNVKGCRMVSLHPQGLVSGVSQR